MIKRRRPGLTDSEQAEVWRNKKSGSNPPALGYSLRTILAIVLSCMNEVPS